VPAAVIHVERDQFAQQGGAIALVNLRQKLFDPRFALCPCLFEPVANVIEPLRQVRRETIAID
jgi:hypothetical protein